MESPEINPCINSQLFFSEDSKNTQWEKDSLWNSSMGQSWISTHNRMKLDPYPTLYIKINSKCIKSISKTWNWQKFLEGNKVLQWFLAYETQTTNNKSCKINKQYCIKLKLCTAKKTVNRIKGQPVEWDKILADHISDKWLI